MNRSLATALLLLCASCGVAPTADLSTNWDLYHDTEYACKLPGDRTVFVAPLDDQRAATVPPQQEPGGYPIEYDSDGRWERPVVEMIDAVLRREVEASNVFAATCSQPIEADIVITPTLVTFATAAVEQEDGGCSLAEIAVRVQAFGPVAPSGQRPLLLDQVFTDRKLTEASFRTGSRYRLAGAATRAAVLRLLQGLDAKNIGRNGIPTPPPGMPVAPVDVPAAPSSDPLAPAPAPGRTPATAPAPGASAPIGASEPRQG